MATSTGYGPSANRYRLYFDGDERKYELWEVKFLGYMRIKKLHDTLTCVDGNAVDEEQNAEAFAELVQYLDDRSLSLIIREARDDGRRALKILRDHYLPKGKPRVITLYTELTSLQKNPHESVTDYIIRAETAASSLKDAGETISDSLLVAMVLKGLSPEFKAFTAVITQKDKALTFSEFKVALRNFEDTEKVCAEERPSSVLRVNAHAGASSSSQGQGRIPKHRPQKFGGQCYTCGKSGHMATDCWKTRDRDRWCELCRTKTHDTQFCRKGKRDGAKSVNSATCDETFIFKVGEVDVKENQNSLLVDCGATTHIVNDESQFIRFDDKFNPSRHVIELADGSRLNDVTLKRGDACVKLCDDGGNVQNAILENALYVPSFSQSIFSVQAATQKGARVEFKQNSAKLYSRGTKFNISKKGNLYYLNSIVQKKVSHSLKEWHEILGHCNTRDILELQNVVEGMHISDVKHFDCGICIQGKMTQHRNRNPDKRAKTPLSMVHLDLAGPIEPEAKGGFKYALCCVDDFSSLTMVYFLKQKSDAVYAIEKFLAEISPYGTVKCFRSDQGGEFISEAFQSLLIKNKIKHEKSAPFSPHQNGTAERTWRSLFEMARCLILQSGVPKNLWVYAVMASAYTRNRCYNPRTKCTPFESFAGEKPNIANMHIFGSTCYAYVQNPKKLDNRSEKGVFVGYDKGSPAYLVYFPESQKIKKVRCVKFTKESPLGSNADPEIMFDDDMVTLRNEPNVRRSPIPVVQVNGNNNDESQTQTANPEQNANENEDGPTITQENVPDEPTNQRPKRNRARPKYLDEYIVDDESDDLLNLTVHYCCNVNGSSVPLSYQEAVTCKTSEKWQKAMNTEMQALEENDTFELTTLPEGRKAVGGRWVYAIKLDQNNEEQYKARFVAKGYSQVPNTDYHETFSPTARITSIRTLMQLAVQHDLTVHQMDVKAAYLNAPIDCELYVEQPEGFVVKGEKGEKLVYKLRKSLYGLKQSGRNWNNVLHTFLLEQGFSQSLVDPCVYTMHDENDLNANIVIVVWVDDLLIATNSDTALTNVKTSLMKRFKMKDLGKLSWFLGIEFAHEKESDTITMGQTQYIKRLLERFGMQNCKPKYTPSEINSNKLCNEQAEPADATLYREIVGGLIYLMTATRPDLCYIVTRLSQYMAQPNTMHMSMAKHVLKYLKGTSDLKLIFRKSVEPLSLIGFCDADWGNSEDRKSITGYGFTLSDEGPLISWKSRKQPTVALSTCEAEYMALSAATQEGKFLKALMLDMTGNIFEKFTLFCDNQGAMALAKNPIQHQRSKHIDIRYHFVRDEVQAGSMETIYVPSEQNIVLTSSQSQFLGLKTRN